MAFHKLQGLDDIANQQFENLPDDLGADISLLWVELLFHEQHEHYDNDDAASYSLEFSNLNFEADSHQQGPPSVASSETVYSNHDTEIGDSNDRQEIDSEQESIVTPQRSSRSSSILKEQCSDMIEEDEQVERACGRPRRRCSR
jgi:hypothetical protein